MTAAAYRNEPDRPGPAERARLRREALQAARAIDPDTPACHWCEAPSTHGLYCCGNCRKAAAARARREGRCAVCQRPTGPGRVTCSGACRSAHREYIETQMARPTREPDACAWCHRPAREPSAFCSNYCRKAASRRARREGECAVCRNPLPEDRAVTCSNECGRGQRAAFALDGP